MTHLKRAGAVFAGLATTLLVATLLTVTATRAVATDRTPSDPYPRQVVAALDTCLVRGQAATYDRALACVERLAGPDTSTPFQVDLWDVFRECLYFYYKSLDSLDPGEYADVNECLERHGYDVGLP
jgi:hypothetical protein